MTNYKNLELRDGILRDANILMRENPNLKYEEAYEQAKRELIGDNNVLDIEVKPFEIIIDDNLIKKESNTVEIDNELYKPISNKIDISKYDKAQLKQYLIGNNMGIDITLFADPKFSAKQIRFLCIMMTTGKDVDNLFTNYEFDPNIEFANISNAKTKQYSRINTIN